VIPRLGPGATFAFGAFGAVVVLLVVRLLPVATELARGAPAPNVTGPRVLGSVLLFAIFAVGGGVAAVLVGEAIEPKHAIAYGLGWQGILGGVIQEARSSY
jgi:hypothetical protein